MRPVESLLSITNLLTFFILMLPLPRSVLWVRYLAPIALLIAIIQLLVEGWHWQMIPAYALAGLFLLSWLFQKIAALGGSVEQILNNWVTAGLGIGLGILGLVISITLPIVLPVFRFPHPSGRYGIGTLTYHWVDASRPEVFSADPNARREMMAQIWHPVRIGSASQPAPYISDSDVVTTALARLHNFPGFSLQHLKYVSTHTVLSAPAADELPNYPVLIFLEGLTGYRQMNTFQVEELVSQGYVVVGLDQPGAAATVVFPDGHQIAVPSVNNVMQPLIHQSFSPSETVPQLNGQAMPIGIIPYFAQDVSFTLDQLASINTTDPKNILTGKLDLQHIGAFGMSLGGAVTAEACLKDSRIKACLIEDVALSVDVVQNGLQQPCMFITRPAATMRLERQTSGGWAERDIVQTQTSMRSVYDSLPGAGYFVQVAGMYHIDLTDTTYISPIFPTIGFSGPIGSQRAHDITNAYSLAFFNRYLKNLPEALLEGSSKQFRFAEVLFEARRP